jgi:hypothetical protein
MSETMACEDPRFDNRVPSIYRHYRVDHLDFASVEATLHQEFSRSGWRSNGLRTDSELFLKSMRGWEASLVLHAHGDDLEIILQAGPNSNCA